jgi:undecaprenyl diphosphate synthase
MSEREQKRLAARSAEADRRDHHDSEHDLLDRLDFTRLPRHVAIIMDGNGRWARERGLPRVAGHRAGIAAVRDTVETSARLGLEVLTLYAFSRENWRRPSAEVNTLMRLLKEYLERELDTLHEKNVRFEPIGRLDDLPPSVVDALSAAREKTRDNTGMNFLIALSYSGRIEIADAARRLAEDVQAGRLRPEEIDETMLGERLYTGRMADPDLLIRTSGELRVSNFLLWQIAYAELWVTPVRWPDFRKNHLLSALIDFQKRDRRFGRVGKGGRSSRSVAVAQKRTTRP